MTEEAVKQTTRVCFSIRSVRDGRVELGNLAVAYAAALGAATGRALSLGEPQIKSTNDWSDYDYPDQKEEYLWGNEDYGVRALFSGQFVMHGRRAGELGFWTAIGLPAGSLFQGESKLHVNWQSYAQLTVGGDDERMRRCGTRFAEALAAIDVRGEPDGIAVEALEAVLTQLCWYSEAMDDEQAAPLLPAIRAVPARRPAGASSRFLLACIRLAQSNAAAAAPLLEELARQGEGLAFSHGILCGRAPTGLPAMVAWQDHVPAASPYYEVLSAQALVAELGGEKERAVSLYREVADAQIALTSEEAGKQLARLS
jgi:hypothetical protein